ncbi:MAG TPA: phosphoglucosamine mutase [Opitutaceae bacterium]|nr:phosphoglucosamine mutase [Opitutaceae bacterium]
MKRRYFGTDGIRGTYGGSIVSEAFFASIGAAAGRWLESRGARQAGVLVAMDTRASGPSLARMLAGGLAGAGARPRMLGIVPTPAVSRAVAQVGAALGAVVTASHNPASDNGVKFFGPGGSKLADADEAQIESHLAAPAAEPGRAWEFPAESAAGPYIEAASRILPAGALAGWRIALDTANGAACATSPAVFRALGAELSAIGDRPDGGNINEGVGSEHPGALSELVLRTRSRIGVAHDGDGDRCVLCDERGVILDGDEVLAILATHALSRGTLAGKTLVVTVQSNLGVDAAVGAAGGRVVRTAVGDRYVAERMRAEGANLGGESSGHFICLDACPSGDGLVAALRVAEVMLESGRPLSELRKVLRKFPQRTDALRVREKRPIESLPVLSAAIHGLERELGASGRVLVRYSGTETKLRLLVEGPTEAAVGAGMDRLRAAARADLEVII